MTFARGLNHLRTFAQREGHARVSQKHLEGDHRLGVWLSEQRARWRRGKLSQERIDALKTLGVDP